MLIHKAGSIAFQVLAGALGVLLACQPAPAAVQVDSDPVAHLQQQLDRGQLKLRFDGDRGYLSSVLRALNVPVDSQGLVFSKTSFQASRISPATPRALYFNDDVYVGWVWGGDVIELASVDPQHGPVFYLLYQKKTDKPRFIRENASCLQCHQSQLTGDVPGLLMRSVYPDHTGMPVLTAGTYVTTDQSPMNQRWGGWYMDGKSAEQGLANGTVSDSDHPENLAGAGASFIGRFDTSAYLSAHSDPVALLVLAHQTHLHNLLTKAHDETLAALKEEAAIAQALGDKPNEHSDSTLARIKAVCEPVVQCMLFSGEARYAGPIQGSTDFTSHFESLGPRDSKGRSLRNFDLRHRLFKYPCSYLIYSQQFDSLPEAAKQYIYRRMWKVLTGRDDSAAFNHLTDTDRDAVYQILKQTKKDLPAYWK